MIFDWVISAIVNNLFVNWFYLYHIQVHFLAWGLQRIFYLFFFAILLVSTLTWSIAILGLRMLSLHSYDEWIFILLVLLRLVKYTMSLLLSIELLFYFWVVFLSFGLFQVHSQIVKFLRSRCHVHLAKLFFLPFEEVVWSTVLKQVSREFVLVFGARRFDWEIASLFWLYQFNVLIFDVDDCWLFIFSKKIVFFLIFNSPERLNRAIVKINRTEVCIALIPIFQMFFQQ